MAEPGTIPTDGLAPRTPLAGFDRAAGGVRAHEVEASILSLAVPLGGDDAFAAALQADCGVARPVAGQAARSESGVWVAALQADQLWMIGPDTSAALPAAPPHLADAAYATEQSDAWARVRLEGSSDGRGVRAVLARLCMLDLDPAVFPVGAVTRTLMEHMGVVILREEDIAGESRFLLLAPRSYAAPFAHAIETCLNNAAPRPI